MRTIRFVRRHRLEDETEGAESLFWCQVGVLPLKPMMVCLLSVRPVESARERR
jgi:hypothetical protein